MSKDSKILYFQLYKFKIPYFEQECIEFKSDIRPDDGLESQKNSKNMWDKYIKQ